MTSDDEYRIRGAAFTAGAAPACFIIASGVVIFGTEHIVPALLLAGGGAISFSVLWDR